MQRPTSPNWRSRSTSATLCPISAIATARLVEGKNCNIVRTRCEDLLGEAVGRAMREDDDRPGRTRLDCVVDQRQRPLGVPRTGDQEQVVRRLLERRPALVEPVDDADDVDVLAAR